MRTRQDTGESRLWELVKASASASSKANKPKKQTQLNATCIRNERKILLMKVGTLLSADSCFSLSSTLSPPLSLTLFSLVLGVFQILICGRRHGKWQGKCCFIALWLRLADSKRVNVQLAKRCFFLSLSLCLPVAFANWPKEAFNWL